MAVRDEKAVRRKKLLFTAVTSGGKAYDIQFPLHPETRSPEAVSELLAALLASLSRELEKRGDVSEGDVLQALAMTTAIRSRMVNAEPRAAIELLNDLLEGALHAVLEAKTYSAARA